jgi:outer membrane protein assembly factor BamE (lipoprotein component of BamABCDE complex)
MTPNFKLAVRLARSIAPGQLGTKTGPTTPIATDTGPQSRPEDTGLPKTMPRCLAAFAVLLLVAGCSVFQAQSQVRGNRIDPDDLKELVPGTSTRADATALLGSPTARATFDDNRWIYMSLVTRPRIGRVQGILSQNVVVLTFNDQGVLQNVEQLNQDDGLPVTVSSRATPSPGTEASFMQQLFGNIGKFNAGGPSPSASGGGGAPDLGLSGP